MNLLRWKYSWPFVIVGLTILCLVFINTKIIHDAVADNSEFASTINKAGKQRMLSQRLVTHYALLQSGQPGYVDFSALLQTWAKTHFMLQDAILYDNKGGGDVSLLTLMNRLQPLYDSLHYHLSDNVNKAPLMWRLGALVQLQNAYLSTMDSVVNGLEVLASQTFLQTGSKQVLVAVVSGGVLFLEMILFLIPHFRSLWQAYKTLKKQQQEIDQHQVAITRQNNALSLKNEELEKMKQQLALTLSGINAGVWSWNILTNEQEWSPKFYQLLGYQPGEITPGSTSFFDRLFVGHQHELQEAVREHLEYDKPYKLNVRIRRKDGTIDWFELSGQAARDASGKPVSMGGSIIYIGEKVASLQQLQDANKYYNEKLMHLALDIKASVMRMSTVLSKRMPDMTAEEAAHARNEKLRAELEQLARKVEEVSVK